MVHGFAFFRNNFYLALHETIINNFLAKNEAVTTSISSSQEFP